MTARRTFSVHPDSVEDGKPDRRTVSLHINGKPARGLLHLDVAELRDAAVMLRFAAENHPHADYVVGPDGRLWCLVCAEGGRRDECEGAGCPGDNPLAVSARRAAEDEPEIPAVDLVPADVDHEPIES